jgi:deoxyribonuclease-1
MGIFKRIIYGNFIMLNKCYILLIILLFSTTTLANNNISGNRTNGTFNKAKRLLEQKIYYDHRITFYCQADFDEHKNITLPDNFIAEKYKNRIRIEWEHVVPAENFGRAFVEWKEGDPNCIDSKGRPFKGRKCAEKINHEYRYMQADMYNLQPTIGAVNAARQNYDFTVLSEESSSFGSCLMKISENKVEPPYHTRGTIARTYLYMDTAYPKYNLSRQTRQVMEAWDKTYPIGDWECLRYERIKELQGNENPILQTRCYN